ncbi:MAG TPA: XRE family transcriptional regulator [Acidobacteriota bacterium]|nr:XRE family transcriptional regulator [Acidobacteriota bacterium]
MFAIFFDPLTIFDISEIQFVVNFCLFTNSILHNYFVNTSGKVLFMFGERLHLARKSHGLSLRDLAAKTSNIVSAQAIGKYENGLMMPSSEVLGALCQALDVSESYLLNSETIQFEGAEFRKHSQVSKKELAKLRATVLNHVSRYLEIETILRIDSSICKLPTGFPERIQTLEAADNAAKELRRVWQLGNQPISNFPEILEERGIKLLLLDLPSKVSGMTMKIQRVNGGTVLVIVLNATHSGERQRFSGGHELGHNVLALAGLPDEEKPCHRFAGAFWAPADTLYREVGERRQQISFDELFALKKLFGLSIQALIYRMKDLGIISDGLFTDLFVDLSKRGWRKEEPKPVPRLESNRFNRLCLRAVAEGAISPSKGAELLDVSIEQVENLLTERM